ncbi:type II secretion system protein [Campylobacter fetus]|uniref:Type II secretion system protein n=4 Tax=Campylobacter fetus TaxID=196 RepID=A0AAE6IZ18_CAMFE|nr:type II secretion system protein [Campylobacter fetus]OCS22113.1 prepilin cleavage protein [Campylobacter fetus subsp. venerealis cfvi97/532]OCS26696.1 prepilin cleavage protein [Campylobacter fetus subsp. venerealis cfvB10]OCS30528.1 prepilin cleavage protein [Campylobacter fetus subsp. venerealis LMG 6570 = CCUG 33900]OCS40645.1 prepilin cleavage protein [Campylobacter fetus subsp. venerealis cfvi92/203]OCS43051.1 prepilin cleavage protein [Campylobacter fetus subsp. venerealis cfvi02/298
MKHAFTVLELILVIVIVGISTAAVPALVMSSTKTNEAVLLQEAITSSKTKLSQILLYPWNSALNQSNSNTSSFPILKTSSVDNLAEKRPGLNSFYNKRDITRLKDDGTTEEVNAEIVGTAAKKEGINQFDQDKGSIDISNPKFNERKNILKLDYTVTVSYLYVPDNEGNLEGAYTKNTTNEISVKIETTATLSDKKKNVVMRAYSFNIGTPKIITKSFANSEFK